MHQSPHSVSGSTPSLKRFFSRVPNLQSNERTFNRCHLDWPDRWTAGGDNRRCRKGRMQGLRLRYLCRWRLPWRGLWSSSMLRLWPWRWSWSLLQVDCPCPGSNSPASGLQNIRLSTIQIKLAMKGRLIYVVEGMLLATTTASFLLAVYVMLTLSNMHWIG